MSGIEIAGLVLGAFPFLIQALETYREGAEVLKDWWQIERAYKKTHQDLQYHQLLFEGHVERLLLPLVVDEDELRALMADPAGKAWENVELETRLQQRLPKSYNLFLDIIGNINGLMEALKRELGVKGKYQTKVHDGKLDKANVSRRDLLSFANMEFQARRIKFTVRKSAREKHFAQLQDANERMQKLLESSDQISAARQRGRLSTAPSLLNRKLNEFWRHAKRLHEALSTAWQCACAGHVAILGLEHRTSEDVEFNVLFHLDNNQHRLDWHGTKIKMVTDTNSLSIAVPQQLAGGRVRFDVSNDEGAVAMTENMAIIHDLCSALSSECIDCIGFLAAEDHRFMLYNGGHATPLSNPTTITLQDVLSNAETFTRRRRYELALTLASSYLQLGATPWLNKGLLKEDIVFLQNPTEPLFDHPYIRQRMSPPSDTPASEVIPSLGIRLLELCFGKPLEATSFRSQLPAGDDTLAPIFDYTAAIQWSRLVSEEAGPGFAEAIEWCLHAKTLNNNSWRKELWQHVIVPLDACHKQVSQKSIPT